MTDDLAYVLPFCHLDDDLFKLAVFELSHGPIHFNYDRLESLYFNPLIDTSTIASSIDLDPDEQFLHPSVHSSSYFVIDQFNELISKPDTNAFSMIHLNARSLSQNFDKLTDLLHTIDLDFSVIGISETWIRAKTDYSDYIQLDGYTFTHNCRSERNGGGVGIYVNNSSSFKQRKDLDVFNSEIMESIFIEIIRPKQSNIIIGTIYRPPDSDIQLFIDNLANLLAKISNEQKICYLMGDFNLDLIKYQQHSYTNDFVDTMYSHFFLPLITRPTRITSYSATAIDNIFTNNLTAYEQSTNGILFADISDHLPIFSLQPEKLKLKDLTNIQRIKRDITTRTKAAFNSELIACN